MKRTLSFCAGAAERWKPGIRSAQAANNRMKDFISGSLAKKGWVVLLKIQALG
jgi:hypothetical protein